MYIYVHCTGYKRKTAWIPSKTPKHQECVSCQNYKYFFQNLKLHRNFNNYAQNESKPLSVKMYGR